MGGQLTASSVLGQGSAFTVSLPRAPDLVLDPAPGPAPASRPAGPHAHAGAGISILYIEDNPANVEVVSRFLKGRPNTRLRSEASGRAGIEYAVRDRPDLILLDLHLPDLHGDQVLSELKAEPATAAIPVVVVSADASPASSTACSPTARSPTSPSPSSSPNSANCSTPSPPPKAHDQRRWRPPGSWPLERPGRRALSRRACRGACGERPGEPCRALHRGQREQHRLG